jgi:hypothetical protein
MVRACLPHDEPLLARGNRREETTLRVAPSRPAGGLHVDGELKVVAKQDVHGTARFRVDEGSC